MWLKNKSVLKVLQQSHAPPGSPCGNKKIGNNSIWGGLDVKLPTHHSCFFFRDIYYGVLAYFIDEHFIYYRY